MKIAILAGCVAAAFALAAPAQNLVITNDMGPNSAAAINKSSDLGTLERGNIVIIDGDPLQDVFDLTHVLVVKDGRVVTDHRGQHH